MTPTVEMTAEELRARRRALACDALADPSLEPELEQVERELASRDRDAERQRLADEEREAREHAAAEQAEAERIAAAMRRAQEVQAERDHAAKAFDAAARKLAASVAAYAAACKEQEQALRDAGWGSHRRTAARLNGSKVAAALGYAMGQANVHGVIDLPATIGLKRLPLATTNSRLVEPATPNTQED